MKTALGLLGQANFVGHERQSSVATRAKAYTNQLGLLGQAARLGDGGEGGVDLDEIIFYVGLLENNLGVFEDVAGQDAHDPLCFLNNASLL